MRSFVAVLCVAIASILLAPAATQAATSRPSFIVIVTDDQPVGTLAKMANVKALGGTRFSQAIISNPLCCPSRATILTGQYSHTTGTYTNADEGQGPYGGYSSFYNHGGEAHTVAKLLDDVGYRTGLFGKYLNHFEPTMIEANGMPVGWDAWHGFTGKNPSYYDFAWVDYEKGGAPEFSTNEVGYSTNVAGRYALRFIREAVNSGDPFFAYYAPFGPHGPTTPEDRDLDVTAPEGSTFRTPAYNEERVGDKPPYIRGLPLLDAAKQAKLAVRWNQTFGTLESIDRWVGRFAEVAPPNTVFVFISDNGFTYGDHRWDYKLAPYERSIRVPFIIAAPGSPNQESPSLVTNADVTPTILEYAEVAATEPLDGVSLVGIVGGLTDHQVHTAVLLEHLDYVAPKRVPTYCGVRTLGWKYIRYDDGYEELYDLRNDPWEMDNAAKDRPNRLSALASLAEQMCNPLPPGMDWGS